MPVNVCKRFASHPDMDILKNKANLMSMNAMKVKEKSNKHDPSQEADLENNGHCYMMRYRTTGIRIDPKRYMQPGHVGPILVITH